MGYGDELLLTGIVKKAYKKTGKPVALGRHGKNYLEDALWGEVFENNPKIAEKPYQGCRWVHDIKENRPYIDYHATGDHVVYKKWDIEPGEIFFRPEELRHTQTDFIYIEPNVKGSFGGNKDWGFDKWQEVVKRLPYQFIQGRGRKLEGVEQVQTTSFRDACALLSRARLFVGTDGGLHHAAAALGKPAVVVWGGLVGPEILGYHMHRNIRAEGVKDCGSHGKCQHCRDAMDRVSVDEVVNAITECERCLAAEPRNAPA